VSISVEDLSAGLVLPKRIPLYEPTSVTLPSSGLGTPALETPAFGRPPVADIVNASIAVASQQVNPHVVWRWPPADTVVDES
jgi:hypothetical protein